MVELEKERWSNGSDKEVEWKERGDKEMMEREDKMFGFFFN